MPSNSPTKAPCKRSACDRCRSQKLRCYRENGRSSGACHRCIKSGNRCVTSMGRPTGRPPSQKQNTVNSRDNSVSPETSHPSCDAEVIGRMDINTVNLDYSLSLDSVFDSISMPPTDPMLSADFDNIHDFDTFSRQSTNVHDSSTSGDAEPPLQRDLDLSALPASHRYHLNNTLHVPRGRPPASGAARAGALLSQLHLDLCNLLYFVRSDPWNVQDTLRLTISPENSSSSEDGDQCKRHPLIQVSNISKQLEELLVNLGPSAGAADRSPLGLSYDAGSSFLRTTQLLLALSCYIQIVSIYDGIVSAVFEYLASGNSPTCSFVSTLLTPQPSTPTLYLGGLPILPNHKLWVTLLAHQVERQLERIERFIGLPDSYRITSRSGDEGKDVANALFAGKHNQGLLTTVFQQAELPVGEHDTRCVRSLRLKMRQIKEL